MTQQQDRVQWIPTSVTVQVDTREKYPVLFPANVQICHPEKSGEVLVVQVKTEKIALTCGDYRLKEFPDCCVVERKGSQLEIAKNMMDSADALRQARAFRKLAAVEYPYLLIEASPSDLLKESKMVGNPELALHRLMVASAKYGLRILMLPWRRYDASARRTMGTFLVHLMLGCALRYKLDMLPELLE